MLDCSMMFTHEQIRLVLDGSGKSYAGVKGAGAAHSPKQASMGSTPAKTSVH